MRKLDIKLNNSNNSWTFIDNIYGHPTINTNGLKSACLIIFAIWYKNTGLFRLGRANNFIQCKIVNAAKNFKN